MTKSTDATSCWVINPTFLNGVFREKRNILAGFPVEAVKGTRINIPKHKKNTQSASLHWLCIKGAKFAGGFSNYIPGHNDEQIWEIKILQ